MLGTKKTPLWGSMRKAGRRAQELQSSCWVKAIIFSFLSQLGVHFDTSRCHHFHLISRWNLSDSPCFEWGNSHSRSSSRARPKFLATLGPHCRRSRVSCTRIAPEKHAHAQQLIVEQHKLAAYLQQLESNSQRVYCSLLQHGCSSKDYSSVVTGDS